MIIIHLFILYWVYFLLGQDMYTDTTLSKMHTPIQIRTNHTVHVHLYICTCIHTHITHICRPTHAQTHTHNTQTHIHTSKYTEPDRPTEMHCSEPFLNHDHKFIIHHDFLDWDGPVCTPTSFGLAVQVPTVHQELATPEQSYLILIVDISFESFLHVHAPWCVCTGKSLNCSHDIQYLGEVGPFFLTYATAPPSHRTIPYEPRKVMFAKECRHTEKPIMYSYMDPVIAHTDTITSTRYCIHGYFSQWLFFQEFCESSQKLSRKYSLHVWL